MHEATDTIRTQPRLLVVDDNAINRKVMIRLLSKLGYEADLAENGQEAVEAVASGTYGAVLMDCHMPIMDGYEATAAIREKEGGDDARLPIIAVTAHDQATNRKMADDCGMDDFIPKPIDRDALAGALERWVRKLG